MLWDGKRAGVALVGKRGLVAGVGFVGESLLPATVVDDDDCDGAEEEETTSHGDAHDGARGHCSRAGTSLAR